MYWSLFKESIKRSLSPNSHWYIDLLFSLIGLFKLSHLGSTLCCQRVSLHSNFNASCALALLSLLEMLPIVIVSTWFVRTSNMLESCNWTRWTSERLSSCMLCKTRFWSKGTNWSTLASSWTVNNPVNSFWNRRWCFYPHIFLFQTSCNVPRCLVMFNNLLGNLITKNLLFCYLIHYNAILKYTCL